MKMSFVRVARPGISSLTLLVSTALVFLGGCDAVPKKQEDRPVEGTCYLGSCVPFVTPPKIAEALTFHTLKIKASGDWARSLGDDMQGRLSKVAMEGKPYYTILDDASRATPDGTITITSPEPKFEESKDANECVVRKVTVVGNVKLVNGQNRLIASTNLHENASSTQCPRAGDKVGDKLLGNAQGTLATKDELMAQAREKVVMEMRNMIGVKIELQRVRFINDPDSVKDPANKLRFKEGIEFGRANRLDRACAIFDDLKDAEPDSPAVLYNLGYCSLAKGEWVTAGQLCRQADGLTTKPVAEIGDCMETTAAVWRDYVTRNAVVGARDAATLGAGKFAGNALGTATTSSSAPASTGAVKVKPAKPALPKPSVTGSVN